MAPIVKFQLTIFHLIILAVLIISVTVPASVSGQIAEAHFTTNALTKDSGQPDPNMPLTVAEKSGFKATSRSAEVAEFIEKCEAGAEHVSKFVWGKTHDGKDMVGAIVSTADYEIGDQLSDRNVVLLLGNIHSGECAGKEALLMMLRELTHNADHAWLQHNVILFAPNYNADANDKVAKDNRPGQIGPINGMGERHNSQDLDLNRDFGKLESPEARALVGLINKANPHMFVDCHTTNGSKHQYGLTYDIPHNPATAAPIRKFLRQKMMPVVSERLAARHQLTFYYGNFDREHTSWTTYGHQPRYSTEYVGLRGRLGILSEAYSYLDYKGRIIATKEFVTELLNFVTENHETVRGLLDSVDADLIKSGQTSPQRTSISLGAKPIAFKEKFTVKGFKDGQPHDYQCDFIGDYQSTKQVPMPYAYLIPAEHKNVAQRLQMHGVKVEKMGSHAADGSANLLLEVQVDTVRSLVRNEQTFQKHKMIRVESERSTERKTISAGMFVVRTGQPLGRLISYMLESESDDGFTFWNFLDDSLEVGKPYPIWSIAKPVELPLDVLKN
jgi:hypothetical protein